MAFHESCVLEEEKVFLQKSKWIDQNKAIILHKKQKYSTYLGIIQEKY